MRTLVAIPCMDTIPTKFMECLLNLGFKGDCEIGLASGSLIYDARDQLAEKAVNEGFDRVLWLDSDMTFKPDLFKRLSEHLDNGLGFVSGLYFKRKKPIGPVIYKTCELSKDDQGHQIPVIVDYTDYPTESLFTIEACGFGGVMMDTEVIRRVMNRYGKPFFPVAGFGEDLAFCYRCKMLGIPIYCDSLIKMGHLAQYEVTEETFLKGEF